jgi:hypothetical protein
MQTCLWLCLALAWAADPPSEQVRRLGSPVFGVREKAAGELAKLGRSAEAALRSGLNDPDPEVRERCRALLDEALRMDREARLRAFTSGKNDSTNSLPGWTRFAAVAGSNSAARTSFAGLYRTDAGFLEAVERSPREAAALFAARAPNLGAEAITPGRDEATLVETSLLLLVALDDRVVLDSAAIQGLANGLEILSHREELRRALLKDPTARALLIACLRQRFAGASLDRGLEVAGAIGLKEAAEWASEVARDTKSTGAVRGRALLTLALLGSRDYLARLEPFLTDETPVGDRKLGNGKLHAQVRDVALAVTVRLNGGDISDFGFPYMDAIPGYKLPPSPTCLGFATDAQRQNAFKRWKDRPALRRTEATQTRQKSRNR